MKKISILALHLSHGGVEKAICSLSNMLCNDYDIEIACLYKGKVAFELNNKVKINYLMGNLKENRQEFIQSIKNFKFFRAFKEGLKSIKILYFRRYKMIKYIKNCDSDYIISTRIMFHKKLSKYGSSSSIKIAQEHRHHNNDLNYIKKLSKSLYNIDYLMPVSQELTDYYKENLNVKCYYIPHCIDALPTQKSNLKNKNIISVGRLSKEKGYSDMIDVMKIVLEKRPDWHLDIVGDGKEYLNIKNKIGDLNITLHGFQNKDYINKLYLNSSIFCMTSFSESFGIVAIEAESYGLPCVAFESASGFKEIINSQNGFLIENRNKNLMAEKIINLIDDVDLRKNLGKNAIENSKKYSFDCIKEKWLDFLKKIGE